MTIEEQIGERFKEAMRAKRAQELDVLRMIKSQAQIARTAPGFSGQADDAFWTDVIGRYVKQQRNALAEFEKGGDQARAQIEQLRFEIEYLTPFLPQRKGEAEVRALVRQAIAESGAAAGGKMVGKIVGAVMKQHKGEVDAEMVKRIATEELG